MSEVEFAGKRFAVADRVGLMPLMRFAKVAKAGVDSDDLAGLSAMYDLLEQCIAESDWQRFQDHADKTRADGDELMAVVGKVFEVLSERPTSRPSDSSGGPSTANGNSADDSSSRVIVQMERKGRPDIAQMVSLASAASG